MPNQDICGKKHRHNPKFEGLPNDQGGEGRHCCAGCAYEHGYKLGLEQADLVVIDLKLLPKSQAGFVRHRSAHYAYALGYIDGIDTFYLKDKAASSPHPEMPGTPSLGDLSHLIGK